MKKELRYQYSAKHIRRMKLFERQHLKPIFDALHKQITPIVKILREKGIQATQQALDTIFVNSHLVKPVNEIYKTVGLYFANKTIYDINQSAREVKMGFGFNEEFIRQILLYFSNNLLDQVILSISAKTKAQILRVLTDGITNGWGAEKMADLLQSPELTLWRARMIVRTEANKAMNYGQILGEGNSEWESNKIWIAANDHRTRHSHRVVDDQMIDFKDKFLVPIYQSVGGVRGKKKGIEMQVGVDLMSGPGDKHASAGNVINCRCTIAFKAKRDADGRLIRKPSTTPVYKEYELVDYETKNIKIMEAAKTITTDDRTAALLDKVSNFVKSLTPEQPDVSGEIRTEIGRVKRHLESIVNQKSLKEENSINELVELINSKEYSPEIKLQTDSPEVIAEVNNMRGEIVVLLQGLKAELTKKKTFKHTIERDSNDLIKTITSVTL